MDKKLAGQVAIVTGASSGIGAGVAKSLSAAGATVVINYPVAPAKAAAEEVLAEILASGGTGMTAMCDVSKEARGSENVCRYDSTIRHSRYPD